MPPDPTGQVAMRERRDVSPGPLRLERLDWLFQGVRSQTAFVLLIVFVLVGSLVSDVFLTSRNLLNILWAVSVLGIVSLGQTILLVTRNFDMSVASVMGLAGIVAVLAQAAGFGLAGSITAGLLTGVAVGFLNGLLVVATGANPFLITLGTNALAYSAALWLTQSQTLYTVIPAFNEIGRGKIFGTVNYSVLIFIVMALIFQFIMVKTIFGRSLYITGLNPTAGRLSGLNVRRTQLASFVLCGLMAALAGLIITARTGSTLGTAGLGYDFDSIIASVLGGTSLFGGRGNALRTVVGVLVLGVLNNLLILLSIPFESQQIAKGLVFLAVVWADSVLRKP
jgi:ribose/xylose/arabinose/galactoside ABC-type transport system permease subunit